MALTTEKPLRLLVVCPSWVGDVVMATPVLRLLRRSLPGAFIGGLVRPGCDQILAGSSFFDETHVERASGVMGPKHVASKLRPRRYDTALLLTNSFSTALIARIAGIPRRVGYDRDGRGLLLTRRVKPTKRADGSWAVVPACDYYWRLATEMLGDLGIGGAQDVLPGGELLELATTEEEEDAARDILTRAGVEGPTVVLNPGGNNPAKRWPVERFAQLADHLADHPSGPFAVLVNGSPAEAEIISDIAASARSRVVSLPEFGNTLGSLKAIVRRSRLMVTNDTGPRHIAVSLGTPVVSLFGPTDHRWTTVPTRADAPEIILIADPTLPDDQLANDDPERNRIDKITFERVRDAVDEILAR